MEKFNDAAKGIGNISYLDSQDGVLRSIPMLLKIENDLWPSLSLETLRVFHNHKNILVNADVNGINEIKTRKYQIKTDPNTLVFVNYKKFNKQNYISAVDVQLLCELFCLSLMCYGHDIELSVESMFRGVENTR